MRVAVRQILGFGGLPSDRTSATRWLFRNGIAVEREVGNGGLRDVVQFTSGFGFGVSVGPDLCARWNSGALSMWRRAE